MLDTTEVIRRFNQAFTTHDPSLLRELVAEECVMVSVQPAPEGTRCEGRRACLEFWEALAADRTTRFAPWDVFVAQDRAVIQWRADFDGDEPSWVLGVNVMTVRDGLITEALGYSKTPLILQDS